MLRTEEKYPDRCSDIHCTTAFITADEDVHYPAFAFMTHHTSHCDAIFVMSGLCLTCRLMCCIAQTEDQRKAK